MTQAQRYQILIAIGHLTTARRIIYTLTKANDEEIEITASAIHDAICLSRLIKEKYYNGENNVQTNQENRKSQ